MEEIPALSNGTEVDPISYIIKTAGSPVHCNDIAPSRYKVGGKWYYSYLELRECHDPAMLPVAEVRMESVEMNEHQTGQEYLHQEAIRHVHSLAKTFLLKYFQENFRIFLISAYN
jgi:hypothetical protein